MKTDETVKKEALLELTEEVIREHRDDIKKIVEESLKKGIAQVLTNDYSGPISKYLNEAVKVALAEVLPQEEITQSIKDLKPEILKGMEAGAAAVSLKLGTALLQTVHGKLGDSWQRDSFFKTLFEK